jgi:hypothetical protein
MNKWYVSCAETSTKTFMRIAESREAAIQLACEMLQRGLNIQEVGPMLGDLQGSVITSEEIRKLNYQQSGVATRKRA